MRHLEFEYNIATVHKENSDILIYISDNNSGWQKELLNWASDDQYWGPVEFIKRIKEDENWTIKNVGILQYSFEEDCNNLIFQMDELLGFVIIVNETKYDSAIEFIKKYTI